MTHHYRIDNGDRYEIGIYSLRYHGDGPLHALTGRRAALLIEE
jgi:hypothetical protein